MYQACQSYGMTNFLIFLGLAAVIVVGTAFIAYAPRSISARFKKHKNGAMEYYICSNPTGQKDGP